MERIQAGHPEQNGRHEMRVLRVKAKLVSAGKNTTCFSVRYGGASRLDCCRSMSGSSTSTSRTCTWRNSTAKPVPCDLCPMAEATKTKTKTFLIRKNCQGWARSKMSDLCPAVQGVDLKTPPYGCTGSTYIPPAACRCASRTMRGVATITSSETSFSVILLVVD
jgi:hypothetical protein